MNPQKKVWGGKGISPQQQGKGEIAKTREGNGKKIKSQRSCNSEKRSASAKKEDESQARITTRTVYSCGEGSLGSWIEEALFVVSSRKGLK